MQACYIYMYVQLMSYLAKCQSCISIAFGSGGAMPHLFGLTTSDAWVSVLPTVVTSVLIDATLIEFANATADIKFLTWFCFAMRQWHPPGWQERYRSCRES